MKSRVLSLLLASVVGASCAATVDQADEPMVEPSGEQTLLSAKSQEPPAELGFVDEPDLDCDGVPDIADAYPRMPNDLAEFGWVASNGGYSGSDAPSDEWWPLSQHWWNDPVINRCDLNANGILDHAEADPDGIEAAARSFTSAVLAEQALWDAAVLEEQRIAAEEYVSRSRVAVQEQLVCDSAVEQYLADVDRAVAVAEAARWTDDAYVVYDQSLTDASTELDRVLDGLTEISGC